MPIFTPLFQTTPNSKGIHAPSQGKNIKINNKDFIEKYADSSKGMLVSFEFDGISNPQIITAYIIPTPFNDGTIPGEAILVSEE